MPKADCQATSTLLLVSGTRKKAAEAAGDLKLSHPLV